VLPRDVLRETIAGALGRRGLLPGGSPSRPAGPTVAGGAPQALSDPRATVPSVPPIAPAAFVSEADVRAAVRENRKIAISAKTIVTPSARDLASVHRVFVEN
jgi:hypothetical protein